jgi:hypothetical protein
MLSTMVIHAFYLLLGICHQVLALFQQVVSPVSRLGPLGLSVYDHITMSILISQGAATYFQFVSVCYFIHLCNLPD